MLKLNYFLADIFILSAEKQPIKLSWRKIEWLLMGEHIINAFSILSLFGKPTNELLALLFWQNIVSQYHKQIILDATGQKFYIKRT